MLPIVIEKHLWTWVHRFIVANIGIDNGSWFSKILGFWHCDSKMVNTNLRTWIWFIISLSVVFCLRTRSYSYAITQEIIVPIMVKLCRLCYCFKNVFSSIRYCIGKTVHMKTVYGAVLGEDWRRRMKKTAMVKNQGICIVSILHRLWDLRSSGIYTRRAKIAITSRHKPEITHITVDINKLAEVS